jgi:hypothetical protein
LETVFFSVLSFFIKIIKLILKNPIILPVLAVISFSGLYLLFKKMNFKLGLCLLKLVSGILLAGVLILISIVAYDDYDRGKRQDAIYRESKFDRDIWLKAGIRGTGLEACARGKMYNDLTSHYLKKGMSKEEVFALLGQARRGTSYEEEKRKDCLEYEIGKCGIRSGPRHTLVACFENEVVVDIFKSNVNFSGKTKWYQYETGKIIYVD